MKRLNWTERTRWLTFLIFIATATLFTVTKVEPDLIGFGADSTTNIERDNKGNIIKTVEIQQSAKTLWDLLQLFGTLALPLLLLLLANRFQEQEKKAQEVKQQSEKKTSEDNQRGQALENYIDRISDILLDQQHFSLDRSNPAEELKHDTALDIIRARTLEILRRFGRRNNIDHERKGRVLLFLYDVELICSNDKTLETDILEIFETEKPLLNLRTADFIGANLIGANLRGANLIGANLRGADFSDADLRGADLSLANLDDANLSLANLRGANLKGSYLKGSYLRGADLRGADFSNANLRSADFSDANLVGAKYDDKTTLPSGFDPELHGMVKDLPT